MFFIEGIIGMDEFYCEPDFDKVNETIDEIRESMMTDEERKRKEEKRIAFLQSLTDDDLIDMGNNY